MSELRIIPVTFNGKRYIVTDHRMQYDWGQVLYFTDLELPDSFEARFSNSPVGESVGQIGTNNRIRIPKQFFESGEPIYCYITLHDEVTDGRTVYTTKVPIKPSTERTDAEPEPEEESIITQAIMALNTAVEKTAQDVIDADASAQAAQDAQTTAESARDAAQASETAASQSETNAAASASSASQSAESAQESESSARTSATSAARDADRAEQAAGQSGYMFFHIDSNGDLIYERTSNVDVDFRLVDGDLILEAV